MLCKWVYDDHKTPLPVGFTPLLSHPRVALLTSGSTCFVVFRGTASLDDVVKDIMSFDGRCDESGFNVGFMNSYNEMSKQHVEIKALIHNHQCSHVHFTGHSLGGAMAIIAAYRHANATVVTFGGPKMCCDRQDISLVRFVANGDPVPTLPGPPLYHCGRHAITLPGWNDVYDKTWPSLVDHHDILSHRMSNYIQQLLHVQDASVAYV